MHGPAQIIRLGLLAGLGLSTSTAVLAGIFDDPNNPTDPALDTSVPNAPVIIIPAPFIDPISIIANQGVVTPVMELEIAERVNVTDDIDFSFLPTGYISPLLPGRHIIRWTATDLGNNSASTDQLVEIIPSINLAMDQTVGEGGIAIVRAVLSGTAPSYPVTVNFNIGGSNSGGGANDSTNDHSLAGTTGSFVFNEGETEAQQAITIYTDSDADTGETITLQIDSPSLPTHQVFLGYQSSHTIQITEQFLPPTAILSASQGGISTRNILIGAGEVSISAETYDPNSNIISFDWSATDNALSPTAGTVGSSFVFDPAGLTPGYYTIRLTVGDATGQASAQHLLLRLIDEATELDGELDSDDDQIDDVTEGTGDTDNDGIADYLDAISIPNQIQTTEAFIYDTRLLDNDSQIIDSLELEWSVNSAASRRVFYPLMVTVPAGLNISVGPTAFANEQEYAKISTLQAETLVGEFLTEGLVSSDGQVLDIKIDRLANHGDLVDIILPQPVPVLGTNPQFYSFNSINQWQLFVEQNGEQIRTTLKPDNNEGFCPGLDNRAAYSGTLAAGDECLLISVRDGGPNDYDGLTNGAISFMGGVFFNTNSSAAEGLTSEVFDQETETSFETLALNDIGKQDTGITGGASLGWLSLLAGFGLLRARRHQYTRT